MYNESELVEYHVVCQVANTLLQKSSSMKIHTVCNVGRDYWYNTTISRLFVLNFLEPFFLGYRSSMKMGKGGILEKKCIGM